MVCFVLTGATKLGMSSPLWDLFLIPLFYVSTSLLKLWHFFKFLRERLNTDVCFTVIVENGVRLRLNIVDTPGYGDQVNNEGWCVSFFLY